MSRIVTQVDGYPAVTVVLRNVLPDAVPVGEVAKGTRPRWRAFAASSEGGVLFVLARPIRTRLPKRGDLIALVAAPGLPPDVRVGVPVRVLQDEGDSLRPYWTTSSSGRPLCPYTDVAKAHAERAATNLAQPTPAS